MIPKDKFMDKLYIICDCCGYNNLKNRFENYGTCLRCGKVLDKRVYFRAQMGRLARRTPRARAKGASKALLYF